MNTLEEHYLSDEQVADIVQDISDRIKFPIMGAGGGFAPIGVINALMGTSAPQGWLVCDGHVYNITDYPELASYFASHFGASNKFGGNGTTTFAVPDLRGEFLRGTGTNSHSGQGSGANVGTHQDATGIPDFWVASNGGGIGFGYGDDTNRFITNPDNSLGTSTKLVTSQQVTTTSSTSRNKALTSRPTNTSVLFIIKATVAGDPNGHVYSTEEHVVGQWIDGKTIYEKTVTGTTASTAGTWKTFANLGTNCSIIKAEGYVINSQSLRYPIDYIDYEGNGMDYCLNYDGTGGAMKSGSFSHRPLSVFFCNASIVATLQYTKS